MLGLAVPTQTNQHNSHGAHDGRDLEGALEEIRFVLPGQMIGADPQDEESRGGQTGADNMWELDSNIRVEDDSSEVIHLRPSVLDHIANRFLHEGIGDQYP